MASSSGPHQVDSAQIHGFKSCDNRVEPGAGGTLLTTGAREIDSYSASLTVTKRLSNQWMLRGFVNYFFKEDWDVPDSFFAHNDPNKLVSGDNRNGAPFVQLFDRATSALSSTWQWNVNGMYQVAPERR